MWISIAALSYKRSLGFKPSFDRAQLPMRWGEVFAELYPGAVGATSYEGIKNKVVTVRVQDPLWIGELSAQKERLRAALSVGQKDPVLDIKFTL